MAGGKGYAVNKDWEVIRWSKRSAIKQVLFTGSKPECEKYVTDNKPAPKAEQKVILPIAPDSKEEDTKEIFNKDANPTPDYKPNHSAVTLKNAWGKGPEIKKPETK